jgi:diketogulonate reductase-like aldo/keto reductase
MAVAWVINHPAVTAAIIGPRTMEQLTSQLGAADVVLTDEVLDAIDDVVVPGTNFSWADAGYTPPSLAIGQASAVSPSSTRAGRHPRRR